MKVSIEHVFEGIDVVDYEHLYFDEDFNDALGRELHLGRQLVKLERGSERIVRHVCYEPARKAGDRANELFGTSRASFMEEVDYDVATRKGSFRTIPNQWADRFRNVGTIEFTAAPNGMRRIVQCEVKVSLFGFGRLVERAVAAEIEKGYTANAAFTRSWIARR